MNRQRPGKIERDSHRELVNAVLTDRQAEAKRIALEIEHRRMQAMREFNQARQRTDGSR